MKVRAGQIDLATEITNDEKSIVSSATLYADVIGATSTEETLKNHEFRMDAVELNLLSMKVLSTDVAANTTANLLKDITDLSFDVISGKYYYFKAVINYTSAITSTGSRWTINGPTATFISYISTYTLTATTQTLNYSSAYDFPSTSNASSLTVGNIAIIEGFVLPSANGTIVVRFANEVINSAITAKKGSILFYKEVA